MERWRDEGSLEKADVPTDADLQAGGPAATGLETRTGIAKESRTAVQRELEAVKPLQELARFVQERMSMPMALRALTSRGKAEARLTRVNETGGSRWVLESVSGDPYFRAVLYEALVKVLEREELWEHVKEIPYRKLRMTLRFQKDRAFDPTRQHELRNEVFQNAVHFHYQDWYVDKEWQLLMPTGTAINILGTLLYIYDKIRPEDFSTSPELLSLKNSPAYAQEGRIRVP